ncbi:MAG: cytochrome c [Leeuwenhoekiella sp.]
MKKLVRIIFIVSVFAVIISCQNTNKPNYQYMPNMYAPVGYETYGNYEVFPGGMEAMTPADGSISRGWMPFEYENTPEGYEAAKANLKNPLPYTEENLNDGKELYTIYCAICHGDKGNGQGTLAEREKILGVPAYNDEGRIITEGSVYHVTYYGKNNMGSYATQTTEKELWLINLYVMSLKRTLNGEPERAFVSSDETTTDEGKSMNEDPENKAGSALEDSAAGYKEKGPGETKTEH